MSSATQQAKMKQRPAASQSLNEGMTPKKTALIIVTVIGCIAILWPKVFYPMMFGGTPPKQNLKDQRGGPGGLRQERPAHLHPESIYQAMRERGRAIPATPTVPVVERKSSPSNPPPRIVDGRPGPIPGMRPPMGAGALQQPQQRGSSMGFLMPLYTIGIVVFFGYTIMKIVFKKQIPNAPYGPAPTDPSFRREVFGQENHSQVEDLNGTTLGWREHQTRTKTHESPVATNGKRNGKELYNASLSATAVATNLSTTLKQHQQQFHGQQPAKALSEAEKLHFNKETQQLMEIEKLRKKLEDTERAMAKLIAEMNTDQNEAKENNDDENSTLKNVEKRNISNGHTNIGKEQDEAIEKRNSQQHQQQRKRRDISAEREVTSKLEEQLPEPHSIYLEGALGHEAQILVTDSQTKREEVYDVELNGSPEEPAVVLSSKMTLSLINLDTNQQNGNESKEEIESPLADDIDIIGHEEQ
ncbi:resistance to inhibitors of cholinesterase protein 3 isoform X5 [Scaptodrosophila lebanonensis]|uniref:Resistance to inhibitors of cholinesterase protein 3 isoform X5 n=1 Tax=Drosophila lebanonensis TaxID=7225 RepID=A0A6J2UMF0_DROLE|nr:resistance to inhibitors of cholinesterase protein 3 isoform X5 [Scaptodrosophila lebanonensis]